MCHSRKQFAVGTRHVQPVNCRHERIDIGGRSRSVIHVIGVLLHIERQDRASAGERRRMVNAITAQLAELDFAKAPGFVINGLKREELIASNSMILHELFFASLDEESAPEGELRDALARDFGSVDRWRAEFSAMGKAQGGGSGWVLLTWSLRDHKLINQWAMEAIDRAAVIIFVMADEQLLGHALDPRRITD